MLCLDKLLTGTLVPKSFPQTAYVYQPQATVLISTQLALLGTPTTLIASTQIVGPVVRSTALNWKILALIDSNMTFAAVSQQQLHTWNAMTTTRTMKVAVAGKWYIWTDIFCPVQQTQLWASFGCNQVGQICDIITNAVK